MTELAADGLPALDQRIFVPADDVDALVAGVRDQLAALQHELAAAEAAADLAEEQLASAGHAPIVDDRVVTEVEDAVASLRTAGDLELTTAFEHARARAAARVAEAKAVTAAMLAAARLGLDTNAAPAPAPAPAVVDLTLATPPPPLPIPPPMTIPLPELPVTPLATDEPGPTGPKHAAEPMESGPGVTAEPETPRTAVRSEGTGLWREHAHARTAQWPIPVEALLPMLALMMLLVVVLAWMG